MSLARRVPTGEVSGAGARRGDDLDGFTDAGINCEVKEDPLGTVRALGAEGGGTD
jgi:hypothetical protein